MDRPIPNSYWVIPGRVLAGEYPFGADEAEAISRLARLHDAGIDSFIDLTEDGELPSYRHLLPAQTKYLRFPIVDTQVPNSVLQMQELLAGIRAAIAGGRRLYIHCRAGIGRTGLVIGCLLADQAANGKKGMKTLNQLWLQSERAKSWPKVPQTQEQSDYVRHWPELGLKSAQRQSAR